MQSHLQSHQALPACSNGPNPTLITAGCSSNLPYGCTTPHKQPDCPPARPPPCPPPCPLLLACLCCSCETALVLSIVMMSRMSLTGHVFVGLGDAIVGLLLGLGALSVTGGTLLPLLQALLGRDTGRRLALAFLAMGVVVGVGSSVGGIFPYSGEWVLQGSQVWESCCCRLPCLPGRRPGGPWSCVMLVSSLEGCRLAAHREAADVLCCVHHSWRCQV